MIKQKKHLRGIKCFSAEWRKFNYRVAHRASQIIESTFVDVENSSNLGDEFITKYYSCRSCGASVDPSWKICPKCVKRLIFPEEEDQGYGI